MLECILCGKIIVQSDNPKHYSVCSSCNANDLTEEQKKFIEMGINYVELEKILKQKGGKCTIYKENEKGELVIDKIVKNGTLKTILEGVEKQTSINFLRKWLKLKKEVIKEMKCKYILGILLALALGTFTLPKPAIAYEDIVF